MFPELRVLLTVLFIGYQMKNLNSSCPHYWLRFKQVFENVIPDSALKSLSKDSKFACFFACKIEPRCLALAFHQQRKECHLYNGNVEELGSNPDRGMKVFSVSTAGSSLVSLGSPPASSVGILHPPQAAVDNNTTTCFQTKKDDYQPWFLVDLMETFLIHFIVVYNEADYPERLHDVNYEVYDSDPKINNSSEANCCASVVGYTIGKNIIRCNDGVQGRFVKMSIEKSNFLTLCEVEIYGTPMNQTSYTFNNRYECKKLPEGGNIALGKTTAQSSTFDDSSNSSKGVDGNMDGNLTSTSSCQHSAYHDNNPWWQVDLEWMYHLTSITISNRYDAKQHLGERLSDVRVTVYDSDPQVGNATSQLCIFIPGVFGCTVRTFECDQATSGRFIRISKPTEFLTLCEVEVTGIRQ